MVTGSLVARPTRTEFARGCFVGLRDKYAHAIQTAKNLRFDGSALEEGGKLLFRGTVNSQDDANRIWDAIKTVPDWQREVQADIKARPAPQTAPALGAPQQAASKTYTVRPGDTLSKIAKEQLGDTNAYRELFNANRDQLSDPDVIKPGQVLKIPTMAR
jgi:LysM repeat protein